MKLRSRFSINHYNAKFFQYGATRNRLVKKPTTWLHSYLYKFKVFRWCLKYYNCVRLMLLGRDSYSLAAPSAIHSNSTAYDTEMDWVHRTVYGLILTGSASGFTKPWPKIVLTLNTLRLVFRPSAPETRRKSSDRSCQLDSLMLQWRPQRCRTTTILNTPKHPADLTN